MKQVDANHLIRRLNISSGAVTTVAGTYPQAGMADGAGTAGASFCQPKQAIVDASESFILVVRVGTRGRAWAERMDSITAWPVRNDACASRTAPFRRHLARPRPPG